MDREEHVKRLKELCPWWKPMEERSDEENERIYDESYDWGDDEDE